MPLEDQRILFEDNHLIAINKNAGELVQGDKTGDTTLPDLIKGYIAKKYDKQGNVYLGVPHRLDRPTSGVVFFARTSKALSRLNKIFAARETQKTYWAVIPKGVHIKPGRYTHYLHRNKKQNKSYAHDKPVEGCKKAVLELKVKDELDNYLLLEIDLLTGRHHQIRSQLSALGTPIKGDLKYGARRSNPDGSIHLHARSLYLIHPVRKEPITVTAPLKTHDPIWKALSSRYDR